MLEADKGELSKNMNDNDIFEQVNMLQTTMCLT
jgi:hypothetical protein